MWPWQHPVPLKYSGTVLMACALHSSNIKNLGCIIRYFLPDFVFACIPAGRGGIFFISNQEVTGGAVLVINRNLVLVKHGQQPKKLATENFQQRWPEQKAGRDMAIEQNLPWELIKMKHIIRAQSLGFESTRRVH